MALRRHLVGANDWHLTPSVGPSSATLTRFAPHISRRIRFLPNSSFGKRHHVCPADSSLAPFVPSASVAAAVPGGEACCSRPLKSSAFSLHSVYFLTLWEKYLRLFESLQGHSIYFCLTVHFIAQLTMMPNSFITDVWRLRLPHCLRPSYCRKRYQSRWDKRAHK